VKFSKRVKEKYEVSGADEGIKFADVVYDDDYDYMSSDQISWVLQEVKKHPEWAKHFIEVREKDDEGGEETVSFKLTGKAEKIIETALENSGTDWAEEQIEGAREALEAITRDMLGEYFGDHVRNFKIVANARIDDSYVGSNCGSLSVDITYRGDTKEIESAIYCGNVSQSVHEYFEYNEDFEASWLLDSESPGYDYNYYNDRIYTEIALTLAELTAYLKESEFTYEIERIAKEFAEEYEDLGEELEIPAEPIKVPLEPRKELLQLLKSKAR